MTALHVSSDLNVTGKALIGHREGLQWWQTFTIHAVGVGQQDMGVWLPVDYNLIAVRYRLATAGTGSTAAVELRLNGIAGGNTIAGTSATPSATPAFTTPGSPVALNANDLLWCYMTAINTTPGGQLKAEIILERR